MSIITTKGNFEIKGECQLMISGEPQSLEAFRKMIEDGSLKISILNQSLHSLLSLRDSNDLDRVDMASFAAGQLLSSKIIKESTTRKTTIKYETFRAESGPDSGSNSVVLRYLKEGIKIAILPELAKQLVWTPYTTFWEAEEFEDSDLSSLYLLPAARKKLIKLLSYEEVRNYDCGTTQLFEYVKKNNMEYRPGRPNLGGWNGEEFYCWDTAVPDKYDVKESFKEAVQKWGEKGNADEEELRKCLSLIDRSIIVLEKDINFNNLVSFRFENRDDLNQFLDELIPVFEERLRL